MNAKAEQAAVPAEEVSDTEIVRRPLKVQFFKGADWNGGSEGCLVDQKFAGVQWRAEIGAYGVWFYWEARGKAVFVPHANIRFIECAIEG